MRELCTSSHTPHERTPSRHTLRDSLSTSLSRSLPERCWCVSMVPATPPPPLPSAAITARRRAADALSAGQWVAMVAGEQHDFAEQGEIRPCYMMQSDYWDFSRTRPRQVSYPYGCSTIDTDLLEGIGRNDVVVEEAL